MKKLKCLLAMCLVFPLFGCSYDKNLDEYQGRFVDINSDAYIEISKNTMKIFFAEDLVEEYKIKLEGNELVNEKGGGFGMLSSFRISDGKLTAYEMILDDDGHRYDFVREEIKAKLLEVVDKSTDMPKTIESTNITHFSLSFATKDGRTYDLDESWPRSCYYGITLDLNDEGKYELEYNESFSSYMGRRYSGEVDKELVDRLYEVIARGDVVSLNGYYFGNNANLPSLSLYVTFDSAEEIVIRAEGNGADACPFALSPIMEVFLPLIGE